MELLNQIIGIIGGIGIMIAYYLISTGKVDGKSRLYNLLNIVGSLLLLVNTVLHSAHASTLINIVWIVIGVRNLIKYRALAN